MSSIIHLMPEVHVANTGKARKKKRAQIPSRSNRGGRAKFCDVVVGGALWMLEHGRTCKEVGDVIGADWHSVWAWKAGIQRPHCVPREPDAIFWNAVRALTCAER